MINCKILTATELKEMGLSIGRLSGNRSLDPKNVKSKMESLKETGLLIPAVIVEAEKAIAEGLEVVDFETKEKVTDEKKKKYVVTVDANNRYAAHLNLLKQDKEYHGEFYFMFPLQEISVTKMLSEINIKTNPWRVSDYGKGIAMSIKEQLPLLSEINEMTEKGYSVESACKWLTFGNKVNKNIFVDAMNGSISDSLKEDKNIDRGKKLLESAKKAFSEDFLKKRTLPDWIISKSKDSEEGKSAFVKKMCSFLSNISRETADEIENYSGKRGGDTKESKINRKLNELWEEKEFG